jgi:hypothetical protein
MKILPIDQNSDEWLDSRKGLITGSKLKDIIVKRGTGRKIGFYQLIADRLAQEEPEENPMERGHRLEEEAITLAEKKYAYGGKIEKVGLCISDHNPNIAVSPDGLMKGLNDSKDKYVEAFEVKCLSSARHLECYFENAVPSEYFEQVVQYFVVNEDLEVLHFICYDPRIAQLPIFEIKVKREEVAEEIKSYFEYQVKTLEEVNQLIESLAF